jgi:hypothetical protein
MEDLRNGIKLNEADKLILQNSWKSVEENFRWEKVRSVMEFLDWTWGQEETIPTIKQLKSMVRDLMERRIKGSIIGGGYDFRQKLGGFIVDYDGEGTQFEVEFSVEGWDTEYLTYNQKDN